ncbi:BON domain-containing protein [Pseudomonas eucalypticola]|uniref:BON domain-containing protein n=1 Tax=Pseudomonas eucalypticola TaxID=2599595 RepID=A0A7D5D4T3_9PSED|nr:BON domain-containing protein [Pseudomonas eucalypticola]QKZ02980.1 BON domain-containing protein [Pseudomonas eucalypticola]
MKKFAIAAATATALTLAMGNFAFAAETTTNGTVAKTEQAGSDTWITTKVKANLLTEKGIPGSDITVETNHGVVTLASKAGTTLTSAQKTTAVNIAKKTKHVKSVSADALETQ